MPNTTLKRWNPTLNSGAGGFEELYPKTVTSQIAASGTANSTTFLRGDGQWATPSVGSHTHTIGYYNSAITSNLDTLFGTGEFGFANTTTGRPEDYGQGINIVSSGTAHNGTDNWITQLAFGTTGSTSFFRTKVNTGAWTAWRKIWNDANDGAGSGLDADLLDGQHGSYFLDTSGSSQTKTGALTVGGNLTASNNAFAGRYYQSANGIPTGNLGSPTVTEMALFDEQFYNQTNFYDITKLKFYTSTDNVTWTEVTTISDTNKRALVGGDAGSGITIPNLTPYYRIEITNNGNYVFLNALYMYVTTSSHSMSIKIKARRRSDLTFVNITSSNNTVNLWPGHVYMPFNTIPFLTGGSSSGHYDIVHIDFQPTWSGDPTYGSFAINLHKLQVWGGYPAGKRNIYSTDENRNVTFPAALTGSRLFSTIATGTSPLSVTSTTVNTNLNADLLDGLHSSSFFRVDGTYPNTNMNTIVEGYWHVEPTAANVPIAQYGHRWDYDHLNNGQWAAQFYSATSDTDSLWFRQIRNYVAQPWQKLWSSTNDGTGSGLDADLLDGNHASAFLLTTARNAANGVAPLGSDSKVPLANLPDFLTGASKGFFLAGTLASNTALSGVGGLVQTLSGLVTGGAGLTNLYGATWVATAQLNITWTDQTALNPNTFHVLTPGDEADATSPVTLEAGDMIVFTKYSATAGTGDDEEYTFSIINNSDPRFANYLPLTGGTMTGTITSHRSDGQTHNTWALASEPSNYYLDLNTVVTPSNVRWNFNQRNSGTNYNNVLVIDTGKIGIGTSSPGERLEVNGNAKATTFISTQATGTAPLTVASTTAVTNLNADLLDGNHAAAFYLATNPSGYTSNTGTVISVSGTGTVSGLTLTGTVTGSGNLTLGGTLSTSTAALSDIKANLQNQNANNITISGFYHGDVNVPTGDGESDKSVWHNQFGGSVNWATQLATSWRNGRMWIRNKENGTWESWYEVFTENHLPAISEVTGLQTALDAKAPLASPALTGTPTAPTATAGTNTTQIATTAFVSTAVANLINSAPGALDTLDELAAALGDDANFASTVTNALAGKASTVHTHGNLNNSGVITNSPTTVGSGDAIMVAAATGAALQRTTVTFGTGTTTFLRNDGAWATPADTTTLTSLGLTADATELNYVDGVTSAIQTQLNGKAATSHTHTASQISDSGNVGRNLLTTSSATASTLFFKKNPDHTITLEDAATFRTSTGTAAASHTHAISDVTNLQTSLDGKAATSHSHAASDVTSGTFATARIPTLGNITNAGAIGSTANLGVVTTTSGVLTTRTLNDDATRGVLSSSSTDLTTERNIYWGTRFIHLGVTTVAGQNVSRTISFTTGMKNFILQLHQDTTTGAVIARLPLTITNDAGTSTDGQFYSLDTTTVTHRVAWSNGSASQIMNVSISYSGTTITVSHNFNFNAAFRLYGY